MEHITEEIWKQTRRHSMMVAVVGMVLMAVGLASFVPTGISEMISGITVFIGGICVGFACLQKPFREAHKRATGRSW